LKEGVGWGRGWGWAAGGVDKGKWSSLRLIVEVRSSFY
jgi:hypothetical protein